LVIRKGHGKETVFLCQNIAKKTIYICKVASALQGGRLPLEALVFNKIKENPQSSLAQMHELILIGTHLSENIFIEVIEYYSPKDGWHDLLDFIESDEWLHTATSDLNKIFMNVVEGLAHLFELGYVHGDIKGNILLITAQNIIVNTATFEVKIIDFDMAKAVIPNYLSRNFSGTLSYFSPQILQGFSYSLEKNQVWQLGCILYILYFKSHPFRNEQDILRLDIVSRILSNLDKERVSESNFLMSMLAKEEIDRPTLAQVSAFASKMSS
jgi:serine/threonine protein kinase